MESRCCTRCGETKSATLEFFPPHKMGKYGLHSLCRPCKKLDDAELRARPDQIAKKQAYRDTHKDTVKKYNAEYRAKGYKSTADVAAWRAKNLEHSREQDRLKMARLRKANPEKYTRIARAYAERNRVAINARASANQMRRYYSEPWFNLKTKFAVRLRNMVAGKAYRRTEDILGFSRKELLRHIERQFTRGMDWDGVLNGNIHIDHVVPVVAFKCESIDDPEFKACWALSNLRPLWASENAIKSDKLLTLL